MEKAYGRTLKALRSRIQKAMIHPPVTTNAIPLLYSWARSGTTLLNKCLSAMGHLVLSETHVTINSGVHAPRWQATNWLDVHIPSGTSWKNCILKLNAEAKQRSRSLIIRDWTTNSFYANDLNHYRPSNKLQAHNVLGSSCRPIAFVRNAIDCTLSFAKFHKWQSVRQLNVFAAAYLAYVKQLSALKLPIFHYEDLCRDPEHFFVEFCSAVGIQFFSQWQDFGRISKVLGDTYPVNEKGSRAVKTAVIKKLPRRKAVNVLQRSIVSNQQLQRANTLLKY